LPNLLHEIEAKLDIIEKDLRSLPQSFCDNPQQRLLELCAEFNKRVADYTDPKNDSTPNIFEDWFDEYDRFEKRIISTQPQFEVPKKPIQEESSITGTISPQALLLQPRSSLRPASTTSLVSQEREPSINAPNTTTSDDSSPGLYLLQKEAE
jgi:hypothetical protein